MKQKKNLFIGFTIAIMLAVNLASCKKYEEGPGLSFRSKKERIANEWKIEKAMVNGTDVTNTFNSLTYKFTKGGSYEVLSSNISLGNGTWYLDDKKDNIILKAENSSTEEKFEILKLKEDEFWIKNDVEKKEFHLKEK